MSINDRLLELRGQKKPSAVPVFLDPKVEEPSAAVEEPSAVDLPLTEVKAGQVETDAAPDNSMDIQGDFRAAALEVLRTYRSLDAMQGTLLRKVEGINWNISKFSLNDVAEELCLEKEEAESILNEARAELVKAAKKAGVEIGAQDAVDALRVFETDKMKAVLIKHVEGKDDVSIGSVFSPVMTEEGVRICRNRILDRMASALAGGEKHDR